MPQINTRKGMPIQQQHAHAMLEVSGSYILFCSHHVMHPSGHSAVPQWPRVMDPTGALCNAHFHGCIERVDMATKTTSIHLCRWLCSASTPGSSSASRLLKPQAICQLIQQGSRHSKSQTNRAAYAAKAKSHHMQHTLRIYHVT